MRSISVIVPIYYGEKYISGIIEQVEMCRKRLDIQDYVEILFVNDAPDAPLFQKWQSETVHIVVVDTDENVGIQGARLKGLKKCCGDYVLFLDQDDKIWPEYLCSQLHAIGENDAVVCRAVHGKKPFYSRYPVFENILSKDLMLSNWNPILSPGQVLLKRRSVPDLWVENILTYNGADDWFLWLCMLSEKRLFALNYDILYEHVLSGENASDDVVSMLQSEQEVINIVQEKGLFSDRDFKLLMKGFFLRNKTRTQELGSFKEKIALLDKWMKLEENNIRYDEYLIQLGLQTIAIYGCGTLGTYLYTELKDNMDVKYFIDRNAGEIHKKIPVYSLEDELPDVDGVIITLIRETDGVRNELDNVLCTNILILKDWIRGTNLPQGG